MNKNERISADSQLLRTFVTIADCGNLTVAASRLNRSQSAISVQLRKLETELGTSLFRRDKRGMSLSADGVTLLPAARSILAELGKLSSLFRKPLAGRIKVGIPDDFDEGVLERTLAEFSRSNPGVEVRATSGCTAAFPDAIREGTLDVAVYSGPGNVIGEPLLTQKPVWVAGDTLHLQPSDPVPLAVNSHGCWMGQTPRTLLAESGRAFSIAYECSGLMSLKAAIRAGFAVGVLFETNVESGMKILSAKDGFPKLPRTNRSILVRAGAPQDLAAAMSDAIRQAVRNRNLGSEI